MVGLSTLGSSSAGVWTRRQALQVLTPGAVRGALRAGLWQVLWPGVYADAGYALTAEQRCWAAVLASGGAEQPGPSASPDGAGPLGHGLRAVACGRTAARFWSLPLVDDDDPATGRRERLMDEVHVWTHLADLRHDGRVLRRHRLELAPDELVRSDGGLWVTTPLRTLVDLASRLPVEAAVCAVDAALHRGHVTVADLTDAVLRRRGRPGSTALQRAVRCADGRAESPVETLARLILKPVLPALEPQVVLQDAPGRVVARFDLADRTRRLAVEADGKAAHAGAAMVAKDRARDLRTEAHGWWTERVTWSDVRLRPAQTANRVLSRAHLLDQRRAG